MVKQYDVRGTFDPDNPLDPMIDAEGRVVEKPKHSQALRDYAFLGPARSLPKLHKKYAATPPGQPLPTTKSLDTLKLWSACFDWQRRIAIWDQQEADRDLLDWELRRRALREADWNQGGDLRDKVGQFLERLPTFLQDSIQERTETLDDGTVVRTRVITVGLNTSLNQIAQALLSASKLQRLATDEPTENITISGAALDSAIERELAALAAARNGGEAGDAETPAGETPAD